MQGIVVISNGGFAEQSQFQALEFMIDRMARNISSEVIARIFRGQGPLLTLENEQNICRSLLTLTNIIGNI